MAIATVFGGSGFIGRYVVQRLAKAGYTVRIPTRDGIKANALILSGAPGQIVPLPFPLGKPGSVEAAVAGADVVINLLGILYETRRQKFQSIHVDLPARIAAASAAAGVIKLVHISAIGASADSPSLYAQSKAAGEMAVRAAFPTATILRPSVVFGAEDGFFNMLADLSAKAPLVPVFAGGHMKFQPVYVGDVADAILASLTSPEAEGQTYELGGPRVISFRQALELTQNLTHRQTCIVSLPWSVARLMAFFMELTPKPQLTSDQIHLLKADNVVSDEAKGLRDLGIDPTAVEAILPKQLARFTRKHAA